MTRGKKRDPGRAKRGRPSLGDNARTKVVPVKLSEIEYAAIAKAVKCENAEGQRDGDDWVPTTISSWLRDHALDPLGLMPRESSD